ncbi:hypothetical protein OHD62_17220 [Mesorhizobium sp. YC-39]|uniref:hypothetical protein n=1 Tax=unclassified Mesorhizobium TaxID=325217 RepID=UPI0021E79382|nr:MULTISPECIES: hypothetical protein [unclassified Mesorhizobium]MCV3209584.1 hypothetical protein [Mesorhizobium sp. YC-2]MCV3230114.1 hypothetical protein [Mesorhizobium sp. YC-39]
MPKRIGGLSAARVDEEFPHQVALPDDICVGHNFTLIRDFVIERQVPFKTRSVQAVWQDGKYEAWRLHCFADEKAAEAFLHHFGGVSFDPKRDRANGRARGFWRRKDDYKRILDLGPLSVPEILRN